MYDMTKDLAKIDQVIAAGHFKDTWGSLAKYQVPHWYQRREVWNFYSLGRLQCAGIWKRMVSAS